MKKIFIAFIGILFTLVAKAQTSSAPYYCGFETEAECQAWQFRNAPRVTTSFAIGSAIKSTGARSLYTTYDGGITAGYDISGTGYSGIAYTQITLDKGWHNLYFDYKILTGADYQDIRMMVSLVPATTNVKPFATAIAGENFNKNATAGKIWLSDPDREYKYSGWNVQNALFNVTDAGEYYLVFLFKQKGISEKARYGHHFPDRTGVNIDNIIIDKVAPYGSCLTIPKDVTAEKDPAGVKISWTGTAGSSYDLIYYRINRPASDIIDPDTVEGISATEYHLPYATVPYGVYTVKVRASCSEGTSAWAEKTPVIIYGPSDYCIEYWDLDARRTKCTMGSFGYPFDKIQKLDYGYESRESYHTVHWDTAEYDPVTNYQLKTVLDGHWASVRLGQGAEFGPNDGVSPGGPGLRMSAGLTYTYRVPDDAELFLLNYAPVLQFAAHHPENEQTQIVIDVLDQFGSLLDSKCLKSKFNSIRLKLDEVAGVADPGWHNFRPQSGQFGASGQDSPDEIKWHDWMIMGFNLKAYAGELVQFRISLDPCGASYHFAYIYLVPMCASASVQGMSCSEKAETFEVPDGFKYRWYKQNDRTMKVVCRDRFFTPDPTDTDSYYVDLMNKEDTTCFFTLEAYILPRKPKPEFTYRQIAENCTNTIAFDASATRIYEIRDTGNVAVDPAKAKVSNFTWNFGAYGIMTGVRPKCTFPNEGGTFPVTLTCEYGGCTVDTTFDLTVAPIPNEMAIFEKTICQGDVFTVNRKDYTQPGITFDTIPGGSFFGCDSIIKIDLRVIPHTTIDTTVSVTSDQLPYPLRIDGKNHTFTAPKDTIITVESREMRKCDSITYNIRFEVISMLDISLDTLPEICADDPRFTIKYIVNAGFFDTIHVRFDTHAADAGFTAQGIEYIDGGVVIPMPATPVRPDQYHCDIVFGNDYGTDTLTVPFTILYPTTVIAQRWNDLLAIRNSEYNGGYTFVAYQWYHNGQPIDGAIRSQYYTAPDQLDFSGEYTVLLTRADDGKSIFTCPYTPIEHTPGTDGYTDDITVTIHSSDNTAHISVSRQVRADLYTSTGTHISTHTLTPDDSRITLPTAPGLCLLRILHPDGRTRTIKLTK